MDSECSICFHKIPLLVASCGHKACQKCFQQVAQTTSSQPVHQHEEEINIEDAILSSCPSKGRCPFCRRIIDIFSLKQCDEEGHASQDAYEKIQSLTATPISGLSYQNQRQDTEVKFPRKHDELPYLLIVDTQTRGKFRKFHFEDGFWYHEKTQTFVGTVDVTEEANKIRRKWECIMQFSSDFRHVIHGGIIKRPILNSDQVDVNNFKEYPLDGKWIYRYQQSGNRVDRNSLEARPLTVHGNSFQFEGFSYDIQLGNEENARSVHFQWPGIFGNGIIQVAESGIDLNTQPDGPDVGDTIVWTVNDPQVFRIFWTRVSKVGFVPRVTVEKLGGNGTILINQQTRQSVKPTYHKGSPWGNVFVQSYKVGLASYHFISQDGEGVNGAYISYEHLNCSGWPSLDDGSMIPSRVPFVDHSYDSESRTFRGVIPWQVAYGTCWQGMSLWTYEIIFDSEFLCIISGGVTMSRAYDLPSRQGNIMSYGERLIYINAAIVERLKGDNNSENSIDASPHESEKRVITTEIMNIRNRLMEEDAQPRTISVLMGAARGALSRDLIDYNL